METNDKNEILENARIGYQAAINLMIGQSQVYWSKFNALIVANSIIIVASATIITMRGNLFIIPLMIASFIGILLNLIAIKMLERSNKFHDYWRNKAKKLEEDFLNKPVNTISSCSIEEKWCIDRIPVKCWAKITLLIFALVYLFSFMIFLIKLLIVCSI